MHPHFIEGLGQGRRADIALEAQVRQLASVENRSSRSWRRLHWLAAALRRRRSARLQISSPGHGWVDSGYTTGYSVTVGSQLDLTSITCWAKDDCATVGYATAPDGAIFPMEAVSAAPPG